MMPKLGEGFFFAGGGGGGVSGSSESQENLADLIGKISTDNILCNIPSLKYKPTGTHLKKIHKVETKKVKECESSRRFGN